MAKSHPARFFLHASPRPQDRARPPAASNALLASIVILGFLLTPVGERLSGPLSPRHMLELAQPRSEVATKPIQVDPETLKYRAIGEHLAHRYQTSVELTTQVVAKAFAVGGELKLDPMLILAVIAVESRFNPAAESVMGAKGLMQVIPRFHPEKFGPFGGEHVAFEPAANIAVGARILKEYLGRTGNLVNALQLYVGATTDDAENGYSGKVMAERDRLQSVLRQFQLRLGDRQQQAQAHPQHSAI